MRKHISKERIAQWAAIGPVLDALGSPIRQHIVMMFKPGEQINVKSIVEQFKLSRTAVVHHINTLIEAGILVSEKTGKGVMISLNPEKIHQAVCAVLRYVADHGNPQAASTVYQDNN